MAEKADPRLVQPGHYRHRLPVPPSPARGPAPPDGGRAAPGIPSAWPRRNHVGGGLAGCPPGGRLVSLGHRLAQVPELGGYAFSPDGRHLARLARRGGDLTVEALAPGAAVGPGRVHADDPLLSLGTELSVPSADHIWIRSGWPGCFQLLDARRSGAAWRTVPIAESGADGLRLLTCLEGSGCDLAVSTEDGESTIWR